DLCKARDILLRIAATDAEGVELENLARQVLVEPAASAFSHARVRTDRLIEVQVTDHRLMVLDDDQHVFKSAHHMGADGLDLESASENAALGSADGEVIGPEIDQPFEER